MVTDDDGPVFGIAPILSGPDTRVTPMRIDLRTSLSMLTLLAVSGTAAHATMPYMPVPVDGPPILGPTAMPPFRVYGKEFSHDRDYEIGPAADPEQVLLWDGSGGTANGVDYTGSRAFYERDDQVDAIANHRDALFGEVLFDAAHLAFSHDDEISVYGPGGGLGMFTMPSAGPVFLSNGFVIGGAGELSVEHAGAFGAPGVQTIWAKQPEIDGMPEPRDVDGVEVWGKEPDPEQDPDGGFLGDADKYSLEVDASSGISVWNASGTPYIPKPMIDMVVTSLLGAPGMVPPSAFDPYNDTQGIQGINLDALMVFDSVGDPDRFDADIVAAAGDDPRVDQNGEPSELPHEADMIIFSIRQLVDPADPDGYYATGSELFVLDSFGGFGFLDHGGHLWDHDYALSELMFRLEDNEDLYGVIDVNAIEAIGEEQFAPPVGLPGDFNGDGTVDAADYAVYRDNLSGSESAFALGSGSGNGTVGPEDYTLWRSNFGASIGPLALSGGISGAGGVPEPSSLVLLALPAIGLAWRRLRG